MKTALNALTLGVALLPTIVIMALVLSNARYKREPIKKIASVFGMSALSTIAAVILEMIGSVILAMIVMALSIDLGTKSGLTIEEFLQYMLVVGPAEEACKYFTFKWIIFHDRDFDNTYDGVIYGAASALGFATLENLMYVFVGNDRALETAAMRAVLSIPLHAITGIVMGYWFGIAKYRRYNNIQPDTHPEHKAFIFAVVIHGAYDFIVSLRAIYAESKPICVGAMLLLIGVMIFIYVLMGKTIHRAKVETHNIYNRYYYEQLGGAIQDMSGGKTSEKRRFFGMPFPFYRQQGFNPYNPYAGMNLAPVPAAPNAAYVFGTQQPYNPYYAPAVQQTAPTIPPVQPPQGYLGQYDAPQPVYQAAQQQPDRWGGDVQTVYGPPSALRGSPLPGFGNAGNDVVQPPKRYCGNCGAEQKPGVKYCRMCGNKLPSE